jgi:O-antigen/teichoic acid export membrane protein
VNDLVRCKVCGYLSAERKLKDKCPACGAPRAVFEPYKDRISEKRRKLLDLHLHHIFVHFPQAFSVAVLVLALAPFVFVGKAEELLFGTLKVLALALPVSVAASLAAGVFDGRTRFKQIRRSPILKRKLVLSSLLAIASAGMALRLWGTPDPGTVPVIVLALLAFFCSYGLGTLGIKVANSEMPGH